MTPQEKYRRSPKYRAMRERSRDRIRRQGREARARYTAKNPDHWLRSRYGLSGAEVDELKKNGCGICGTMDDLVVDHNHATGKVRGALCRQHNAAIGLLGDDPDLLRRATAWLERE